MTKDEMKNRISLALKDPTLQQGFEIICKENAELQENYKKRGDIITSLENQLRLNIHSDKLAKAMKHLKDLVYVVELGKNELATARILAEAKEFLKEE